MCDRKPLYYNDEWASITFSNWDVRENMYTELVSRWHSPTGLSLASAVKRHIILSSTVDHILNWERHCSTATAEVQRHRARFRTVHTAVTPTNVFPAPMYKQRTLQFRKWSFSWKTASKKNPDKTVKLQHVHQHDWNNSIEIRNLRETVYRALGDVIMCCDVTMLSSHYCTSCEQ